MNTWHVVNIESVIKYVTSDGNRMPPICESHSHPCWGINTLKASANAALQAYSWHHAYQCILNIVPHVQAYMFNVRMIAQLGDPQMQINAVSCKMMA